MTSTLGFTSSSSPVRQRLMIMVTNLHSFTIFSLLFFSLSDADARFGYDFNARVQPIKSPGNYKEAKKTCENLRDGPWHLPSQTTYKSEFTWHENLIRTMETNNITEIWLSLKRRSLLGWSNIDNTVYDGRVQENGDIRKTCALVKLRYEAAVSDFCESSGYGYICQRKNCTKCPPDISPHNCLIMQENCYILGCDAGSWFEANNRCISMGTTLATLRSEDEVVRLVRKIKRRPNNPCQHFWVGILKAKWTFHDNPDKTSPQLYFWNTNHPVPGYSCSILRQFDVGYYWASTDCQARHEFFCVKQGGRSIVTDDQSRVTSTPNQRNNEIEYSSSLTLPCPTVSWADVTSTINTSFHLQAVILVMLAIIMIIAAWATRYHHFFKSRSKDTTERNHSAERNQDVQENLINPKGGAVV